MDLLTLSLGSRLESTASGAGTVTFVGKDYVGIAFDDGKEALIRRDDLARPTAVLPPQTARQDAPWPQSTFVAEADDAQHLPGSHWGPFVEDSQKILAHLQQVVPHALVQTGYGADRPPARPAPADWPQGFGLVWPLREQGLALVLCPGPDSNRLVSLFPFFANGSQHTLTVHRVLVWRSGLEAQITAGWGDGEVTFFDTQYLINRAWYEAGQTCDFILAGMAYAAAPAQRHEWTINRHPDELAWLNLRRKPGEQAHEASYTLDCDGAALFLPLADGDVDDYRFHAPVKKVSAFNDWLGQDGWRVRATVLRFGNEDGDLDILITRRAWSGTAPPQVGQDIEGHLWLQGRLWMPGSAKRKAAPPLRRA